ncbi:class C sortase [Lacticaseibacillus sharpeae]|uniref:Sortase n=1 Tax=Lacticaseibacillus sharpeae JCM 1186 = DSM 20505 TaxID=1291052 RepID=A0A0R1ZJ59_9LACO|nr:class C sortase [Lacticaseibacillus sharpeae]KRM54983.1 Sortase [Lacticaseibacillus sharpeae JCM 1186 = DSM 20505]
MRGKARQIIMIILFGAGLLVFAFPFAEMAVNHFVMQHNLQMTAAANQREAKRVQELQKTKGDQVGDSFSANNLSKAEKAHMLGTIDIPSIKLSLPVFDVATEASLNLGAGVVRGTDMPVGGKDRHTAISAHNGIPTKVLFTNLHLVKKGDVFVITVNGVHRAYQVERKQTVKPTNVKPLARQAGRDLATLITCTPYMINTHRLLVTGHRVPYTAKIADAVHHAKQAATAYAVIFIVTLFWVIFTLLCYTIWRLKWQKDGPVRQ